MPEKSVFYRYDYNIDKAYTELGTQVEIRIRKKVFPGIVTKNRFYETNYKK